MSVEPHYSFITSRNEPYLAKDVSVTLPHFQLPADLGEFLDKLILTYHSLAKPSTSAEFAKKNKDLGKHRIVGRGLAYLVNLGLMKKAGGGYDLTSSGQLVRKALVSKTNVQQAWQLELKKHGLFKMMQDYLKQEEGMGTAVGFGNYVKTTEGKNWAKQFTEDGGRRICSLYASKGLMNYDEETGSVSMRAGAGEMPSPDERGGASKERELLYVGINSARTLNVRVSSDLDPKKRKEIIDMILSAASGETNGKVTKGKKP